MVSVDSPMTPDDYVQRLHLFVEGNPEPVAATYHLGVRAGRAQISTQIRLARSATASITVTLGACIEEVWSN
jgi:sulfur-oxidizing protein SoxY